MTCGDYIQYMHTHGTHTCLKIHGFTMWHYTDTKKEDQQVSLVQYLVKFCFVILYE